MKQNYYIFTNGNLLRKDYNLYFESHDGVQKEYIPIHAVSDIFVYGHLNFNKSLFESLREDEILLHLFSKYGRYIGTFYPASAKFYGKVLAQQLHHYVTKEKRKFLVIQLLNGSFVAMRTTIQYYQRKQQHEQFQSFLSTVKQQQQRLIDCHDDDVMLVEAIVRKKYYECFNVILNQPDFKFTIRSKQPPKDAINTLISFGNSCLYSVVQHEIFCVKLDERISYVHATTNRYISLSLDIADIFKPYLVDRTIFMLVNKRMLKLTHFSLSDEGGIYLNHEGKKIFLKAFEEKLTTTVTIKSKTRTYRSWIREELYKLKRHLQEVETYHHFQTKG